MNRLLLFLVTATVLTSCDGGTNRSWHMTNLSGTTFQVKTYTHGEETFEVLTDGQSKEIFGYDNIGGDSNPGRTVDYVDSLWVIAGLDTMKKDYTLDSHWVIMSEQTRKIPSSWEHDFWFVVEADDF